MSATRKITSPTGATKRTARSTRFVLCGEHDGVVFVRQGSSNPTTIRRAFDRSTAPGRFVFDLVDGVVVMEEPKRSETCTFCHEGPNTIDHMVGCPVRIAKVEAAS